MISRKKPKLETCLYFWQPYCHQLHAVPGSERCRELRVLLAGRSTNLPKGCVFQQHRAHHISESQLCGWRALLLFLLSSTTGWTSWFVRSSSSGHAHLPCKEGVKYPVKQQLRGSRTAIVAQLCQKIPF
ncbi:hypothetical protein Anapl_05473 [Anas platyrhynchos]|uniref:Uncharacterized protein n=1 Tax=Anas platyrhynchos TaxID=8839 RepID=R0JWK2_ANAPL|nr:hypothetical protein Anapl_05473 [Anas platyrhynchos]